MQLGRLSADQKRRAALSRAEDEKFIAEFMAAARKVFELIDVDNSNSLATQELVDATTQNQEVIQFMVNCGNKFLQDMLVPRRLRAALTEIDADGSGEIDKPEWCASESETLVCLRRGEACCGDACRGDGVLVA